MREWLLVVWVLTFCGLSTFLAPRVAEACLCLGEAPLISPPDEATDVPLNVAIVVHGPDYQALHMRELRDPAGVSVPLESTELAWGSYSLRPTTPLSPDTRYELVLETSGGITMWTSHFTTGATTDVEPPAYTGTVEIIAEAIELPERAECYNSCFGAVELFHRIDLSYPPTPPDVAVVVATFSSGGSPLFRGSAALLPGSQQHLDDRYCGWASSPRFSPDQELCVSLTAFDAAGNASPPINVCTMPARCGGFDPETCAMPDECVPPGAPAGGCSTATAAGTPAMVALLFLVPLALAGRRRRSTPVSASDGRKLDTPA